MRPLILTWTCSCSLRGASLPTAANLAFSLVRSGLRTGFFQHHQCHIKESPVHEMLEQHLPYRRFPGPYRLRQRFKRFWKECYLKSPGILPTPPTPDEKCKSRVGPVVIKGKQHLSLVSPADPTQDIGGYFIDRAASFTVNLSCICYTVQYLFYLSFTDRGGV